ncbi:hypothetical protein [Acinetobacter baumannii]|uniref:hypothetical protein n=1 Tax=Acinetobacter baumannii TaxID=470 RepID=UPI00215E4144|nr:hypothetical protein [Acinetobacter baumannii]
MLQIRLDVLAAARQLATAYFDVPKAEFSLIQNYRDGSILVEISAKTRLDTSLLSFIFDTMLKAPISL